MYVRCSEKTLTPPTFYTERGHYAGDINRAIDKGYNVCTFVGQASAGFSETEIKIGMARALNATDAITNVKTVILSAQIPADMPENDLRDAIRLSDRCCEAGGSTLSLGDICVSNVTAPVFTFTSIAIEREHNRPPKEGESIIMAGTVGNAGVGALLTLKRKELEEHFSGEFLAGAMKKTEDYLIAPIINGICEVDYGRIFDRVIVIPATEGGVLARLWDLKSGWNVGFNVDLRAMPILQETVEICEYLEVNPYRLASDGAAFIITSEAEDLLKSFQTLNIPAAIIGEITDGNDGNIKKDDEISSVSRPEMDELFRFL